MHHFYPFKICLIVVTQNFHAEVMNFNILFSTTECSGESEYGKWTKLQGWNWWQEKDYEELPFEIQEKVPITWLKQLLS